MIINMSVKFESLIFYHNNNIKCVGLTIKYIGFEPIHYIINLDVSSSSMISTEFDFLFLSMFY